MLSKIKDRDIKNFCEKLNSGEISTIDLLNEIKNSKLDFFWHPLGFLLGSYLAKDKEKIRIHIWPKDGAQQQKPYWNIHNHIFHLTSWVLEGEITNQDYHIENDNQSSNCIYQVNYLGTKSCLLKTNKEVRLEQKKQKVNKKGDVYIVETDIFHHSIRTSNTSALTVVLSIEEGHSSPLVIGDKYANDKYEYSRIKVESKYLENLINEFY